MNDSISPATSAPIVDAASSAKPAAVATAFAPPDESAMPDGDYGKVVRLGQQVFMETGKYVSRYVGNNLSCASCHLNAG